MELPVDLTYGRVAQSRVNLVGQVRPRGRHGPLPRSAVPGHAQRGERRGADVIHAHWAIPTGPAAVQAAQKLGLPSVITMHGGDVYVNPEQGYDFPTRWYVRPPLRWTLRHAGALTAITDDCRQHALRAGAPDESDPPRVQRHRPPPLQPRARRGKPRVRPAVRPAHDLRVPAALPAEGIRFLIEAAAQLKPRFPDLQVVVAGDGFERPELIKLAETLGIGEARDLPGLGAQQRSSRRTTAPPPSR